MTRTTIVTTRLLTIALLAGGGGASGQSLYERPVAESSLRAPAEAAPADSSGGGRAPSGPLALSAVSLTAIEPPKPREFAANDLVTIIVSERSQFDREQSLESEKSFDMEFDFTKFIDLIELLETRIEATSDERLAEVALNSDQSFDGEGEYKKEDRLTDRIQAKVLEVKPNGTLLIEARRSVRTDEEETVVTLSGLCRAEDVTDANTVQSNQLYDMALDVQNSGELERSSRKGLIPRVLETLFNF